MILAFILALTVFIYLPGLVPTLSGDDFVHVYRNQHPPGHWHQYFLEADGREYRPLIRLTLALDHFVWGAAYRGFHLTNLMLHLLATILVFVWGRGLVPAAAALAGTALFAFHPIHSYSVNAVMGRTDVLCLIFLLASMIALEKRRAAGSTILFAAALLSKEVAIVFPLMVAARLWLFPEMRCAQRRRGLAAIWGAAVVYLAARWTFLAPDLAELAVYFQVSAFGLLANLASYMGGLVLPVGGYVVRHWVESLIGTPAIFAYGLFVLFAAVGVIAYRTLRQGLASNSLAFMEIWILATLLPVLLLFQRRFLYIPSVGFCLLAGWLVIRRTSRAQTLAAVFLGAAFAAAALSASLEWNRASRITAEALPALAAEAAAEPELGFWALNVPHGVGQAHLFTHDSLRYALALETGYLPDVASVTRIQRGRRASWTAQVTSEGVLTRITPGPQEYFVFDLPELLPRGGRFLPVGTAFRKGAFRISVVETDSRGMPSALLVSWDSLPPGSRVLLFQPSGQTEMLSLEEDGRQPEGGEGESRSR